MNGFRDSLSAFMPQPDMPQAPGVPPRIGGGKRVPKKSWQDKAYILGAGLRDMGGGEGNLDAASAMFGKRDAQSVADEQRQRLIEQARAVITDPREWAVFLSNPEAWSKETATRYGAATMGEGATRVYGDPSAGGSAYTAPTSEMSGDQAVQYGGPEGFSILGTRNPTFDEQTGRMNADTGRMNAERPMAVGDGAEVIDRSGRVIYRNAKTFAPPRVGGGGGGGGDSSALRAIEAELRRRGLKP